MKTILTIIKLFIAASAYLFAGILIAGSCTSRSSSGPMNFDLSAMFSIIGLIILVISNQIVLIGNTKKWTLGLVYIYTLLLLIYGIYIIVASKEAYEKQISDMAFVVPPNGLSVFIFFSSVLYLLVSPLYKFKNMTIFPRKS